MCVPLPGFPVCYCGHDGGRRAGLEGGLCGVLCASRSCRERLSIGRAQGVLVVACGLESSSSKYILWMCLKSAAVALDILSKYWQHYVLNENDNQDKRLRKSLWKNRFPDQLL